LHVASESDRYGYDIEDVGTSPPRRIEVKGSRSAHVSFYLSRNELDASRLHGERYEIQFWGAISLERSPLDEYQHLRALGYPIRFIHVARLIDDEELILVPTTWLVQPSERPVRSS
jgi:hypothetical protein